MSEHRQSQVSQQLREIGVTPGGVLLVHCAFSRVQPVEGGPLGLIAALDSALGPAGTLVMSSLTDDKKHPFDPQRSSCVGMGVVAQSFWQQSNVLRSNSPHAFAAKGPAAAYITAPHPIDFPHGLDSPVGRVYELDGQVLLLGVGQDANTTIHLAEALGGVRYRRKKTLVVLQDAKITRLHYAEIDHCCQNFSLVDGWLDAEGLQRRAKIARAEARLMCSLAVVHSVTNQVQRNETVFLHPFGVDAECDEARAHYLHKLHNE